MCIRVLSQAHEGSARPACQLASHDRRSTKKVPRVLWEHELIKVTRSISLREVDVVLAKGFQTSKSFRVGQARWLRRDRRCRRQTCPVPDLSHAPAAFANGENSTTRRYAVAQPHLAARKLTSHEFTILGSVVVIDAREETEPVVPRGNRAELSREQIPGLVAYTWENINV